MPKFKVSLSRASYEYAEIEIEAETADAAEALAVEKADNKQIHTWEPCDGEEADPPQVLSCDPVEI